LGCSEKRNAIEKTLTKLLLYDIDEQDSKEKILLKSLNKHRNSILIFKGIHKYLPTTKV